MLGAQMTQRVLNHDSVENRSLLVDSGLVRVAEAHPSPDASPPGEADGFVARDPRQPRLGTNPSAELVPMAKPLLEGGLHRISSVIPFLKNDHG
jgi:hypothetical protein